MAKIGIITIPDYNNYGNRLQNYAVKTYFERKGYETVSLEMNDSEFKKYKARKYKLFLKKHGLIVGVFLFEVLTGGILKARRELYFEKFTEKYLNAKYMPEYNEQLIAELNASIDYFVLGSDQIWHPFVNDTPNLYFARFTKPDKKIYFAPSFGVKELPSPYAQVVKNELIRAEKISIREVEGAEIIKKLTGKQAEVLVDPTLLLSASDWEIIEKKPKDLGNRPFMLCYFLGKISPDYQARIDTIQSTLNVDVYYLADRDRNRGYINGPSEFLYCVHHAQIVLTDSFHAAVFSVIFHKQFNVFSRLNDNYQNAGLDSRVDTLLKKMHLEEHKYIKGKPLCVNVDFSFADEVIHNEKHRTECFINSVMKIEI